MLELKQKKMHAYRPGCSSLICILSLCFVCMLRRFDFLWLNFLLSPLFLLLSCYARFHLASFHLSGVLAAHRVAVASVNSHYEILRAYSVAKPPIDNILNNQIFLLHLILHTQRYNALSYNGEWKKRSSVVCLCAFQAVACSPLALNFYRIFALKIDKIVKKNLMLRTNQNQCIYRNVALHGISLRNHSKDQLNGARERKKWSIEYNKSKKNALKTINLQR